MSEPTTVLTMGACLLHGPLNPLARERKRLAYPKYGPFPGVYTFGEMFQALDILLGKADVPAEIRPIANIRPNFVAKPSAVGFNEVDVVLVEPSSPVNLCYRGCYLNRTTLAQIVIAPIRATGREAAKAAGQWLRTGLVGFDEAARLKGAEDLVKLIPKDLPERDFFADVILETRSSKVDVLEGLKNIASIMQRPMGVVVYVFQYLSDGRALSWPEGFLEEVLAAAEELDLPVFQPAEFVRSYGVKKALRDDLRHYNEEFTPVIAEALAQFADSVAERNEGRSPARAGACS
jgi:hypothetical protein